MASLLEWKHLVVAGLLCGVTPSCKECNDIYVYPTYQVIVVNIATGERVCDAQVSVMGENTGMRPVRSLSICAFEAIIPDDNTVTIEVKRDGFAPASKTVSTRFETDDCGHAVAVEVRIDIAPV